MPDKIVQTPPLPGGRPSSPRRPGVVRRTGVLLMLLAAGIIGTVAGLLSHAADNNIPSAILTSGGAFAGTASLLLAIAHYADAE